MATTIYFNGRVTSIPGSYSQVDASGLSGVGLGASGIIACIGEAEGGQPAVIHNITNPGKIGRTFKSGDLPEAGQMLFDPSKDPDVPAGAQAVKFVKVNPATQSALTLANADGDSIVFTSKDYGAFTEKLSVDIADGSAGGKSVTVTSGADVEVFDDIGLEGIFDLKYAGPATATATLTDSLLSSTAAASLAGRQNDYVGRFSTLGLDSEIAAQPAVSSLMTVSSSSAADTTQTVTIYGAQSGSMVSETLTLNGVTPVVGAKFFDTVFGVVLSAACAGTLTMIDGVPATIATVAPAVLTAGLLDMSANPLEVSSAALSLAAGGASTEPLCVIGVSAGLGAQAELVTLSGTTAVASTIADWTSIQYIGLGGVAAANTVNVSGLILDQGTVRVASSDVGDVGRSVTIYGLDMSSNVQSETVALDSSDSTTLVTSTGSWSKVLGLSLDAAAIGNITVSSANQSTTIMTVAASATTIGLSLFSTAAAPGSVVGWSAGATAGTTDVVVIGTNAAGSAVMEKVAITGASSGTTTTVFATITGIAAAHLPNAAAFAMSWVPFSLSTSTYSALDDLEDYFDAKTNWSVSKLTGAASSTVLVATLDLFAGVAVGSSYRVLAVLASMVSAVNAGSTFLTAAEAASATGAPSNTSSSQFLTGGVEGATTFSHWQAALDMLRDHRVNTIVVMTTDAAVHAAAISHCTYMAGAGRSERDCVLGAADGTSLSDSKTLAMAMNTRHARLCVQSVDRYNLAGSKETFAPPFTACIVAGMQAGCEVGTSLTFKYLNVLGFSGHDASYTIQDDADDMIQSGLCMIEKVPNVGFRWLRNVTTHLIDDNLAYIEASVNEAVNYSVYNFRQSMEALIGKKGFAGTVTSAQSIAVSILGQLIAARTITSYQNLTIEISADVMTIDVELAPVIPVNFVKTTIHLVSASFASE